MEMTFKLEVFEGPLDLLLHLIDINKIDIYDIPIAMITDQYMDYIHPANIRIPKKYINRCIGYIRISQNCL